MQLTQKYIHIKIASIFTITNNDMSLILSERDENHSNQ